MELSTNHHEGSEAGLAMGSGEIGTNEFFHRLYKAPDLDTVMSDLKELSVPSFSEYITALAKERGEVPERVILRAGIERCYGHQLFRGTRKPSRDTALQLSFGFGLDLAETQELLKYAKKSALYPKFQRDAALIFCLNRHLSFDEAQSLLLSLDITLLGSAKNE